MAQDRAASGDTIRPARRRWQRRRPIASRLDLTAEERATMEEEEKRERRTAALHVQLTPDEKAEIERRAKASGNRKSDYARIVLLSDLKAPAPPAQDPAAIAELGYQLSKIGTNINQLTKVANEVKDLPLVAELKAIGDRIFAALDRVYGG